MGGDDELRAVFRHFRHLDKQGELPLGRQRRFRLVHEKKPRLVKGLEIGQEAFSMGLLMQGSASATGIVGGFVVPVPVFFRFGGYIEKALRTDKIAGMRTAEAFFI